MPHTLILSIINVLSLAIRSHSPAKPVLIFVSSRRQTRLTALDLIAFLATEDDPKQWLHQDEREVRMICSAKLGLFLKEKKKKICSLNLLSITDIDKYFVRLRSTLHSSRAADKQNDSPTSAS